MFNFLVGGYSRGLFQWWQIQGFAGLKNETSYFVKDKSNDRSKVYSNYQYDFQSGNMPPTLTIRTIGESLFAFKIRLQRYKVRLWW